MECGIVGPPLSGKSTLFALLTGSGGIEPSGGREGPRRGVARLPDPRLAAVARVVGSAKVTPATVEYVDVPGLASAEQKREPYPSSYLAALHGAEMLALVVREFPDPSTPHPRGTIDPARDVRDAELEFQISDLATVERRLEKLVKQHDDPSRRETDLLEKCRAALSDDRSLRGLEFTPDEERMLRGYSFLSLKPLLIVLNLGEDSAPDADSITDRVRGSAALSDRRVAWVAVAAGIEAEISRLDEEDRRLFLEALGFDLPALERVVESTFKLLGLITFFTANENEARAWPIIARLTARAAAGAVHRDMERGFIRAEVCRWDELEQAGSFSRLREAGKLRLEGRDYPVADGEVITVRFNV